MKNYEIRKAKLKNGEEIKVIVVKGEYLPKMIDKLLENNKSFLLYGKPGTGKTYSLNKLREYFKKPRLYEYGASRLAFEASAKGFDAMKALIDTSMLYGGYVIIDDLGTESTNVNNFGNKITPIESLLTDVIYREWETRKNTENPLSVYITSNLNLNELEDTYGSRTMSRLNQICTYVYVDGEDLREQDDLSFLE